ncbi:serine hydrolase [Spirosoma soli]|uniref:Beta-lactamase n=1 Tax=Spirosoma soli TaxID=1770529 RepID=A0ABW5M8K7_9BACT
MVRLLAVMCWLVSCATLAQKPPIDRSLDSTETLVRNAYNANQPETLYALTNDLFQKQISEAQFRSFISGAVASLGKWKSSDRPVLIGGTFHFKALFEKATMDFLLNLDQQKKIALFALQPFRETAVARSAKVLTNNPLKTSLDRQVDEALQNYVTNATTVGISVGILRNDSLFTYGYGETAKGTGRIPDRTTVFEIGSVSKTFTATLLADAVRRGLVKLEDPVSKYLPDSIPLLKHEGVVVTLKMLANHTSGLPRMAGNWSAGNGFDSQNPYAVYTEPLLFTYLQKPKFNYRPGTTYEYSNLAMGVLGTIIARKSGQSYEQLLNQVINKPLGLQQTNITLAPDDTTNLATGYNESGLVAPSWAFQALAGAGAIRSTTADLLRYLQANLGAAPPELAKDFEFTHRQTFSGANPVETVGLGWHIINRTGWLWHNGGTGGFRSFVGFNPAHKTGIVILVNSVSAPLDGLDWKIIKAASL